MQNMIYQRGPMGKKDKKKKARVTTDNERRITENRKARHKYEVIDTLECGIALAGSEVKSLRDGKVSLDEAHARVQKGEVWLVGCDIAEYSHASNMNHQPKRRRKLLLHRREIEKFADKAFETGTTLIPLKLYFKGGKVKVLLGICRGRKLHDKREKMKNDSIRRDLSRAMRSRQ